LSNVGDNGIHGDNFISKEYKDNIDALKNMILNLSESNKAIKKQQIPTSTKISVRGERKRQIGYKIGGYSRKSNRKWRSRKDQSEGELWMGNETDMGENEQDMKKCGKKIL
jgi:hypothetical protein